MPLVRAEAIIPASPETVYTVAKDIEHLPEFLPNVQQVTITGREGNRMVSAWVGLVPEFRRTIKWVEEDVWDDASRTCRFRSLSGDWDRYEGVWSFAPEGTDTKVSLDIDYDYNVPLIGSLIKQLLRKLVQRNAEETLQGLKQRVAKEVG